MDPYFFKKIDFEVNYQFNIYSNSSQFSNDKKDVYIGESKPVDFNYSVSTLNSNGYKILFWTSILSIIAVSSYIIFWMRRFPKKSTFSNSGLASSIVIFPHLLLSGIFLVKFRSLSQPFFTNPDPFIELFYGVISLSIIPILVEVIYKEYRYKDKWLNEPTKHNFNYTDIESHETEEIQEKLPIHYITENF